jgi:hypothetical protein
MGYLMSYNIIHLTTDTINGTLFDQFGRNNHLDKEIFDFNDILIDDVNNLSTDRNIILATWIGDTRHFDKIKKLLESPNFILVFCYEYEAFLDDDLDILRNNLLKYNIQEDKVYLIDFNIFCNKSFSIWNDSNDIKFKVNPVFIDTMIFHNYNVFFPDLNIKQRVHFENKTNRKYRYVCYNNDPKSFRVRLVNDLFSNGLDKFGLISLLRKENPLVLDKKVLGQYRVYPTEHFSETYFSVVTESYFPDESSSESYRWITALTEKVFKAFLLNPFILIGGYKSLDHIQKLGFETFSELFDESYDDIFDEDLRYKKVFSEIKRVCDMDVNKLNDLYHSVLIDKVIYNQNVYIDYDRKKHFNKFMKQFNWE